MKMPVSADQDIFPHFKYPTVFFFKFYCLLYTSLTASFGSLVGDFVAELGNQM